MILDIFSTDAFSLQSMSAAIMKAPHKPKLLGSLPLFTEEPIYTEYAVIEEMQGTLRLLNTSARGTVGNVRSANTRNVRNFRVPHIPYYQDVLASDIQNLRAFGSEDQLQPVASYINDQLEGMRADHEATHEWHRIGALKGVVYDGDNSSVIYNYFTEFGITQNTSDFVYSTGDMTLVTNDVIRQIAGALGGTMFGQIYAICGDTYFDKVKQHSSVKNNFLNWSAAEFLQKSQLGPEWYTLAASGFYFNNIYFINYRGKVGDVDFIPATEAYYVPTGVTGLFKEVIAPGSFMETVNTRGQRLYARQEMLPMNMGVKLHTQSSVLAICTRPAAVIKSTYSAS